MLPFDPMAFAQEFGIVALIGIVLISNIVTARNSSAKAESAVNQAHANTQNTVNQILMEDRKKTDGIRRELDGLKEKVIKQNAELDVLREKLADSEKREKELVRENARNEEKLKLDIEAMKKRIDELEAQINRANQEQNRLRTERDMLKSQLDEANRKHTNLQIQYDNRANDIAARDKEIKELREKLTKSEQATTQDIEQTSD